MVEITRRAFVEGAAALPGASLSLDAPPEAVVAPLGTVGSTETCVRTPRLFFSDGGSGLATRLVTMAGELFPDLVRYSPDRRADDRAALWALAARGAGFALASPGELIEGVASGLALISVAQVAVGSDRRIALRPEAEDALSRLENARLLARDQAERQRWLHIAAALGWRRKPTILAAESDAHLAIIDGAGDALLVDARQQAKLERQRAQLKFVADATAVTTPSLCLVIPRRRLKDANARSATRRILQILNASACRLHLLSAFTQETQRDERAMQIAREHETLLLGTTSGFGRHDPWSWSELSAGWSAGEEVGLWTDDLLPYRADAILIRRARDGMTIST